MHIVEACGEKVCAYKSRQIELVGCVSLSGDRRYVFEAGEQECRGRGGRAHGGRYRGGSDEDIVKGLIGVLISIGRHNVEWNIVHIHRGMGPHDLTAPSVLSQDFPSLCSRRRSQFGSSNLAVRCKSTAVAHRRPLSRSMPAHDRSVDPPAGWVWQDNCNLAPGNFWSLGMEAGFPTARAAYCGRLLCWTRGGRARVVDRFVRYNCASAIAQD